MGSIVGILLAAGASRRFGADKLTHSLPDGDLVAVRACRNLLAVTDSVLAVVRPGSERLAALLQSEGAEVMICADADQGMSASLVSRCPRASRSRRLADRPGGHAVDSAHDDTQGGGCATHGRDDRRTPLARPAWAPGRFFTHFRPRPVSIERR